MFADGALCQKGLEAAAETQDQVQSSDLVRGRPDMSQERALAVKVGESVTVDEDCRDDLLIEG